MGEGYIYITIIRLGNIVTPNSIMLLIITTFMVENQKIILKGKLVEKSQIKAKKPINILTPKFNNKKLPLPWSSGARASGPFGPWLRWH